MPRPADSDRLPHDPAFKAIFSHPRMIADALRGYAVQPDGPLDPRTVAALDFSTLEKLSASGSRLPSAAASATKPGGCASAGRGTGTIRAATC